MNRVKLSKEDWGLIAPGRSFPLGNTKLKIKALPWEEIADALLLAYDSIGEGLEFGITSKNWSQKEQLSKIVSLLARDCPHLITAACGLDGEDFRGLPGNYQLDLVVEIIEENEKTLESAIKNSEALVGLFTTLMQARSQALS